MSAFHRRASTVQALPPPPMILSHHPPPYHALRPPNTPLVAVGDSQADSSSKPHINPSVLVIVIILSVVFICSGILHVLARCLGRRRARAPAGLNIPSNSIRGQLQHLFTLHDAGVEQVFIDTLPVFLYGSIRGLKDSADCAVCLNEFANEDRLRLLPKCKHAFHLECIDTWLLSNSTCPLCRRSLLPEADPYPAVVGGSNRLLPQQQAVSEAGGGASCAGRLSHEEPQSANQSQRHGSFRGSLRGSFRGSFRFAAAAAPSGLPEREILQSAPDAPPQPVVTVGDDETPPMTPGPTVCVTEADGSEKVLRVELGKVNVDPRRVSRDVVGTSRQRARSYSMGSYEYVVDFASLELAMQPTPFPGHPQTWAQSKPTHRSALSDSIPELASAGQTPANEDMFWASRGLDTPQSLSRVREIMTPSPGRLAKPFSPFFFESRECSPSQLLVQEAAASPAAGPTTLQRVVNIDTDDAEEVIFEDNEAAHALSRKKGTAAVVLAHRTPNVDSKKPEFEEVELTGIPAVVFDDNDNARAANWAGDAAAVPPQEQRSSSLRLPIDDADNKTSAEGLLRRSSSETATLDHQIAAAPRDKVWEVSVDVSLPPTAADGGAGGSSKSSGRRLPGFSWLRGRGRRLVYSAASPSSAEHST